MTELVPNRPTRVWDPFVRIFHWSLVACVLLNFFVVDDGETLHIWLGYTATALVMARIVWGFVGTRHARFAGFFPTPARLRAHLAGLVSGRREVPEGHNPLGALMMLALMALVLGLGASGWMLTLDAFLGTEWLEEVHEALASTLIGLAGLHAASAIVMGRLEHTNLVGAMITGTKLRR
ncbi:MAG: cytochrome b/b6 domain-containing protein [Proteobacteria bacterium]|nr:cytochrome b/b6 domain-containing protein [Pseudomonadota bacterium]